MDNINFFAETNFRNIRRKFGIKPDDRRRHIYAVGKTGMGKTAMLQNMAVQDIQQGKGMAFIDPHGEASEELLSFVPQSRIKDVVYFNPSDLDFPIAFNIMEKVSAEKRHLIASGLMGVFKKIWPDVWSARMEYILNNAILALLEYPGSTLLGVNKMLSDVEYREQVVDKITDPVIKAFWTQEFAKYTQRYETEATAAIQNKIGQFVSSPLIRNIVGQVNSTINMREAMDKQKILILNLSKGRIGEDASNLLGALLITRIQLAAMSRVEIPEQERKDFYLYVDEFQNFATESFTNILSEARKYRLNLILGHQYISQMEDTVREAVFGNVGTIISFRVGAEDAEFLEKEFIPEFNSFDLVNLAKYNIYLKLMIDGMAGRPFSAETLHPIEKLEKSYEQEIIKYSQEKYGNPKKEVEEKISLYVNPADAQGARRTESAQTRNRESA
ncbi:MAG: type IV secretion system DNA-binding domain-containing protein, partial [Patescibacteria group bacterium]|nr:type IV secretion system DNA-binding domain-containing protein [Patescibacteria group bacterium]